MVLLITGPSHAGKTALARKLLEKLHFPTLSQDHLKMGLIRSGNTALTPMSPDEALTDYLWPITCEIIKTAIENRQDLIVEGCYIPFDWAENFSPDYLKEIHYCCLVLSEGYIRSHFGDIRKYANVAEQRLDDAGCTMESVLEDNARYLALARQYGMDHLLIREDYEQEISAYLAK